MKQTTSINKQTNDDEAKTHTVCKQSSEIREKAYGEQMIQMLLR